MEKQITPMLFPVEPDVFWEKLGELIRAELKMAKIDKPQPVNYQVPGLAQKPLYKAVEVCAMLKISRQTLHQWTKEGILRSYKIKSRLFYLWSDLEKLMHKET